MVDAEWVLRFLTLLETWQDFSGDYRQSMDEYMARNADAGPRSLERVEGAFTGAIDACAAVFGNNAFKRPERGGWRDQALAGVYDAEMVAFATLSQHERGLALDRAPLIERNVRRLFESDPRFEQSARQATNTPARVAYRIGMVTDTIRAVLG